MRLLAATVFVLTLMPSIAHAETCADSFAKTGNPLTGIKFIARVAVADLSPASAIGQVRGIVASKGYDILADEAAEGTMLIEQAQTEKARAFPIVITATSNGGVGTVTMEARLRSAMLVKTEAARDELCGMLNAVLGGKAGLAAAKRGQNAVTAQAAPLKMSALMLSHQISKDAERNATAIPLRYKAKAFTIDGTVDYVIRDGEHYRVAFKIPHPWEETIRLPNLAPFKTDISCLMAKGQSVYALTLKAKKLIKLTGTFHAFDEFRHQMWLSDCRPAK